MVSLEKPRVLEPSEPKRVDCADGTKSRRSQCLEPSSAHFSLLLHVMSAQFFVVGGVGQRALKAGTVAVELQYTLNGLKR